MRLEQDCEFFLVKREGRWQQIRFHDYAQIYNIPGLYERLFYDILKCDSPAVLRRELTRQLDLAQTPAHSLRVLDLGAGNGMVGEQLAELDVELLVGADILPEAAQAARRDRAEVYDAYHVLDFTRLEESQEAELRQQRFNCLSCVAALGFGDIPEEAFATAFDLVRDGGWVAFTIKESFVLDSEQSEFARLIEQMTARGALEIRSQHRYRHRISTSGVPLHYVCYVGRKRHRIEPPDRIIA